MNASERQEAVRQLTVHRRVLGVLVAGALILNWLPQLDYAAEEYLALAIRDNLVVYATARALNALISVIQSVQLSISLGAGVAVNLGEALDPLNDLIERFSGFVLYGLAGLGLQKMVLVATSSVVMKVATSLTLLTGYIFWLFQLPMKAFLVRIGVAFVLVRFFLVVEVGTIAALDAMYFDEQTRQAHSALQLAEDRLGNLREQYMEVAGDAGVFRGLWASATEIVGDDDQEGIADLTAGAIVELIAIMIVRGMVLPLLFLWALVHACRSLVSRQVDQARQ